MLDPKTDPRIIGEAAARELHTFTNEQLAGMLRTVVKHSSSLNGLLRQYQHDKAELLKMAQAINEGQDSPRWVEYDEFRTDLGEFACIIADALVAFLD